MVQENKMRSIEIDKVVLHICAGETGAKLENAKKVLKLLTNKKPTDTTAKVKLPKWGLRPGIKIGTKVTLRGKDAEDFLKKALKAKGNEIGKKSFDKNGNFAFGIKEYIDIEGMKYDPTIGIFGFDVIVNLKRKGYRVKNRQIKTTKIGKEHKITSEDAKNYLKSKYNVNIE